MHFIALIILLHFNKSIVVSNESKKKEEKKIETIYSIAITFFFSLNKKYQMLIIITQPIWLKVLFHF